MPFIALIFSLTVVIMSAVAATMYAQNEDVQSARAGVVGSSIRIVVNATSEYIKNRQEPSACSHVSMESLPLPNWFRVDDRIKVLHCKKYSFVYVQAKDKDRTSVEHVVDSVNLPITVGLARGQNLLSPNSGKVAFTLPSTNLIPDDSLVYVLVN